MEQLVQSSDPAGEYVPPAHWKQLVELGLPWYVPAEQFVQMLAPGAVYIPAPHTTQYDDPVNDW
jgi:hypothetical protein